MSLSPRRREPIFRAPGSVVGLFAVLAAIQGAQSALSLNAQIHFIAHFAFIPALLTNVFEPARVASAIAHLNSSDQGEALFFFGTGGAQPWSLATYAFLHGGWPHLLTNSVWLLAFGAPVAGRIGGWRFFALFLISAIGGAIAHWVIFPFSFMPLVGASAGVSGLMAAAARFVFQPGEALGPPRLFGEEVSPSLSLWQFFKEPRALAFMGIWFVANFIFGELGGSLGFGSGPVAWQAHIGGFFTGLVLFSLFDHRPPAPENNLDENELFRSPD